MSDLLDRLNGWAWLLETDGQPGDDKKAALLRQAIALLSEGPKASRPEGQHSAGQWRKRPIVAEAFKLGFAWPDWWADAVSANKVLTFNEDDRWRGGPDYALIHTLEGTMRAEFGDWIIKGVAGEIYPCKPDIFAATYEPASSDGALASTLGDSGHATAEHKVGHYQTRVMAWMDACFGDDITNDPLERAFRFLEEALELAQAVGATADDASRLVMYTYARPKGEVGQEVGGVAVCLAALCGALGYTMDDCAEAELARVWTKVEAIRAKHAAKPKGVRSSLPGYAPPARLGASEAQHREHNKDGLETPQSGSDQGWREHFIERVLVDVCELPDRTSPDDWPEAMLVTGDELDAILQTNLERLPPPPHTRAKP